MNHRRNVYVLVAVAVLAMTTSGCKLINQLKARDRLNKGVTAYQIKDYKTAEEQFKEAIDLDPVLTNAYLYLAATYRIQFIPEVLTADNKQMAQKAIVAFEDVLKLEPTNENAIASIAGLYNGLRDYDKAKQWHRKRAEVNKQNPEPWYGIGTIDWQLAFEKTGQTGEAVAALNDEEKVQVDRMVDDGIEALNQALKIQQDYVEAMQYLNLLYREKAKLTKDDAEKRKWLREADRLSLRALELKRQQEEQAEKDRRMLKKTESE